MERYEQLAERIPMAVAAANHYMVGIVEPYTGRVMTERPGDAS